MKINFFPRFLRVVTYTEYAQTPIRLRETGSKLANRAVEFRELINFQEGKWRSAKPLPKSLSWKLCNNAKQGAERLIQTWVTTNSGLGEISYPEGPLLVTAHKNDFSRPNRQSA